MNTFEMIVTYVCSWWLVLFMVLPWKVKIAEHPEKGHAVSAPVNPMLKKKAMVTTVLALIPTAVVYLLYQTVWAAEPDMYHAGRGKCRPATAYHAPADINARDTATMHDANDLSGEFKKVNIPLNIPSDKYTGQKRTQTLNSDNTITSATTSPYNADLHRSDIEVGNLSVDTQTGAMQMNGKDIAPQQQYVGDCDQ